MRKVVKYTIEDVRLKKNYYVKIINNIID